MKLIYILFFSCLFTNLVCQTQAEMTKSTINNYSKSDKVLNSFYKIIIPLLDIEEKPLFIQAQRDCIKFKESQCAFEIKKEEGGSIQNSLKYECWNRYTLNRIDEFMILIKEYQSIDKISKEKN